MHLLTLAVTAFGMLFLITSGSMDRRTVRWSLIALAAICILFVIFSGLDLRDWKADIAMSIIAGIITTFILHYGLKKVRSNRES
ncbi:hypothetical protein J2T17_006341 [Paenibacillus mucilaginosus]|uniref:hypothetical protein n=1 Tax=Paenibacillus mucilaginosus TaxID=61624 RepID=UPI003D247901